MDKEQFEILAKELHHLHLESSEESSRKARYTSHPIFYVQQKYLVGVVGEDAHEYSPDGPYGGGEIKREFWDSANVQSYETLDDLRDSCDSWDEFKDSIDDVNEAHGLYIYVDVCAHLTEEAANFYIEQNRHNLREPRTYVKSANRCHELIGLIKAIATGKVVWKED